MEQQLPLDQISLNYRSDKGNVYHGYLDIYEKYFSKYRNKLNNLLEIGLWEGESLRMWREYFTVGNLVGADILDLSHVKLSNTTIHICDQSDRTQLQNLIDKSFNNFDIIIDDGGHWQHQQQVTLGYMFKYLAPGGIFVIEDLHTANNPAYTRPGDISTLDILNEWSSTGKLSSCCMTDDEIAYLEENVLEINVEKALVSDIVFIIKK
jgi:SAM-dependent methyltransferase